ncbi:F-type H+-transporting ATPase subunit epsilon [Anaerobranca californiensis DSM 14826]|jgi:F-type H+-transporting ATPase subunit epsilon|uniref:ATP synthase epsilon chain n=1 Tax=Anaerobranca californiensis DSM 14826 TaxID=1120989 RepID=A0A1M6MBB3_9FIRM|nr:F0F1 ATP synthase subunit epsilon [Anaerobranca californiensis]SHJ80749.1 F-type H+-transporting ATPase subunit epsilon [Anaerobranca californiensis DSM 14826]
MKFLFELVTPERKVMSEEVDMIMARAVDGDIGILANHAPLVTTIDIGQLLIKKDGKEQYVALGGGILEVSKEKTVLLADTAELPHEIDIRRAEEAKKRAKLRLEQRSGEINVKRAEIALRKALTRIEVAEKGK